ncbi:MAG: serine/threonine-protein kinase, partial [Frankia sp.]
MIVDRALVSAALPGYDLGAELGRGGFGLVLGARHVVLDRAVAVKILSDSGDSEHDVSARFRSEARVLAALDHPHIVRVYDYLERSGLHMIIMEQLPAGSLRTRIAAGISPEASAAVGLAMAEALHCAHRSGVLHRDVKAANVLFAADGTLKVTDFGIAKIFEGTETTASIIAGTPTNMAPEQLTGGRLGASTDVYALATVVFEMLAGHPVFGAGQSAAAVMRSHLEVRPQAPPSVPGPIADVLGHALAKDPAARPPSARAFALELADAASASFGPGWAARAALPLRVDDEVREAATPSGGFSTDALAGPTMAVGSRPVTIAGPRDSAPRASTLPYTRVGGRPESTPTTTTTSSSSAAAGLADLGTSYAPTGPAGTGDAGAVDAAAGPAGRARHGGGRGPARGWGGRPRGVAGR